MCENDDAHAAALVRRRTALRYSNFLFLMLVFFAVPPGPGFAQNQQATQHKAGDIVIEDAEAQAPGTGEKLPVGFGTLYVPENRSSPDGKLIEIAFLRFKSTAKHPGPPIIFLEGGPGVSGINSALGNMFRAPVKSRMPILFISGSLDANAPPANVEELRKYLPNSFHLIIEGAEHEDVFLASPLREQVREVVIDFLKGNTPSNSRMKAPPISFVPVKN